MAKKQLTEETTEAIVEVVQEESVKTEEVTPTVVNGLIPEHQVGHQSRSFKTPIQK